MSSSISKYCDFLFNVRNSFARLNSLQCCRYNAVCNQSQWFLYCWGIFYYYCLSRIQCAVNTCKGLSKQQVCSHQKKHSNHHLFSHISVKLCLGYHLSICQSLKNPFLLLFVFNLLSFSVNEVESLLHCMCQNLDFVNIIETVQKFTHMTVKICTG